MNSRRPIDDVVDTLKNAKTHGRGCTLLVGAGCSVKAGIPTAGGFVDVIKERFPQAHWRAVDKVYPKCMAELSTGQRRDLIAYYVDKAKINWAHIGVAQLMKAGFIDRILTTNFDLLVVRACALVGIFPAIYDFAASQLFKPADIPERAVFYLHGQYTGFVLMNTEEECAHHAKLLAPVFEDAGRGRVWIVVGYSGENDPVFDHLTKVPRFDYNLYWVGFHDSEPAKHVRERLLEQGKDAFFVSDFDADDFFVTLAQRLGCFPPACVGKPFSHLDALLENVTPYTIPGQLANTDVVEEARKLIQMAVRQHEEAPQPIEHDHRAEEISISLPTVGTVGADLIAGDYEKVIASLSNHEDRLSPEFHAPLSWAYVMKGNTLSNEAKLKRGEEADRLFALAAEKYQAALQIKPDKHEALNNWGNILADQAKLKRGEEADRLFALAAEKYQAALQIKPDTHEALNNWGITLLEQAKLKEGEEASRLYSEAKEKLLRAESISPGSSSYNLACMSSICGEEAACREWLEKSRAFGTLPKHDHLLTDQDLDNVRGLPWFTAFLASI